MELNLDLDPRDPRYQQLVAKMIREGKTPPPSSGMAASGFAPVESGSKPPGGTVEGRQAGVDAQRKIAEGLRGRGAPKGRTAGPYDVYYGPNIGETLAHAGEQLMGGYMEGQANEEAADIDIQRGLEKAAALEAAQAEKDAAEAIRTDQLTYDRGRDTASDTAAGKKEETRLAENKTAAKVKIEEARLDHERAVELEKIKQEGRDKKKPLPKEIAALESDKVSRKTGIDKAANFLKAFNSGASSGQTESLMDILPGKFTDQSKFNEELSAFAESAARAELKAVGEIRPTDADVDGMKQALFGVGKDEGVNKNLLTEYLERQIGTENQLREAKGEELMEMPDVSPVKGDNWYGTLFEQNSPAGEDRKSTEDMTDEELEAELNK